AGTVRLASFPSSSATILPRALSAVTRDHPNLHFTLVEAEPPESLDLLRKGSCEIVIGYTYKRPEEPEPQGLLRVPLCDDPLYLALPRPHRLAGDAESISLRKLKQERWIAGCPRCRRQLLDTCHDAGFEPDIAFSTDDYVAVHSLVSEGFGVALLSSLMISSVGLSTLELRTVTPTPVRSISAYTTAALAKVPAVRTTLEALTVTSRELRASDGIPAAAERPARDGQPSGTGGAA
ncbi:LysR substrate-binding domain-containing protein, partial [Phytoactinopolyspora endophytica]|uniref:LysR substrate-binding domain-containing protein n=1 Tax=Phytoactinopolyspora endophytica TaxID=1642495 RepID=UPI001F0D8DB2